MQDQSAANIDDEQQAEWPFLEVSQGVITFIPMIRSKYKHLLLRDNYIAAAQTRTGHD